MQFETEADVLAWFQSKPRILTPEFVAKIPWHEVQKHELAPEFVPVMRYMRDVEVGTNMYFDEMRRTPTYDEKPIREFSERWHAEEPDHGYLLERFLGEAGHPSAADWYEQMKAALPKSYFKNEDLRINVAKLFGKRFGGVHMTFGAVNELATLTGYQRLWQAARHPVLETILRAIVREEAMHYFFYWSVAKIKMERAMFDRGLSRFMISRYWKPVGQGLKSEPLATMVIKTLFPEDGDVMFGKQVNSRLEDLPGMTGVDVVTRRIRAAMLA